METMKKEITEKCGYRDKENTNKDFPVKDQEYKV
ncbi:hypothetical protein C5167_049071 [Papaver somniferum]|uniref:Uncharacterized protein n=1 Tax=Papaver somniferum TaxID=3469 RepID=A0A4Y7KMH4_PAPSO|nr:hypothetical protein C5167_049071 [Papaver somniferum]